MQHPDTSTLLLRSAEGRPAAGEEDEGSSMVSNGRPPSEALSGTTWFDGESSVGSDSSGDTRHSFEVERPAPEGAHGALNRPYSSRLPSQNYRLLYYVEGRLMRDVPRYDSDGSSSIRSDRTVQYTFVDISAEEYAAEFGMDGDATLADHVPGDRGGGTSEHSSLAGSADGSDSGLATHAERRQQDADSLRSEPGSPNSGQSLARSEEGYGGLHAMVAGIDGTSSIRLSDPNSHMSRFGDIDPTRLAEDWSDLEEFELSDASSLDDASTRDPEQDGERVSNEGNGVDRSRASNVGIGHPTDVP